MYGKGNLGHCLSKNMFMLDNYMTRLVDFTDKPNDDVTKYLITEDPRHVESE